MSATVANARRDGLHKLTSRLVRTHGTVVIEDLNVAGMTCNRRLARHVAGVGMAELRLSERTYRCEACGLVLDRDLNARCARAPRDVLPELRGDDKRAR